MFLIDWNEPLNLTFRKTAGGSTTTFEANKSYLFAKTQFEKVLPDKTVQAHLHKVTNPVNRIKNFHIYALKPGQKILLTNLSGGYGDQLLTIPVAKILSDLGAEIHILCWPGDIVCWWNLPFIKTITTIPCPWEF